MKGLKKILTGILASAMALSMTLSAGTATPAKAAGTGSITVSNTTKDKDYELYKVFDATYSGDNVAYTYTKGGAFQAALEAVTSPFTYDNGNVIRKSDASDKDITDFIEANAANYEKVDSKKGNGGNITFENLDFGYYYIKSEVGAVVTITNAVPTSTVIDKNQGSTLDKQEKIANGTWLYEGEYDQNATPPAAKVGDTVDYQLVGTLTQYIGENKVTKFTFIDTLDEGLTRTDNVVVKLNGAEVTGYTKTITGQILTIEIPDTLLTESNMSYEITYSAIINDKAVITTDQYNNVVLNYNGNNKIKEDKTRVKNYQISLVKIKDGDANTKLADASFKLYTAATEGTEIPVVLFSGTGTKDSTVDNVYRKAMSGETGVEMVTGATGIIVVKGLDNGDYYFEETKAPAGYNKLTARTQPAHVENADAQQVTVENSTGAILPSTGGIGTTIFYIIGGLLIVAAVVFFVVRRKGDAE